jgi:hypothetical protein
MEWRSRRDVSVPPKLLQRFLMPSTLDMVKNGTDSGKACIRIILMGFH